MDPTLLTCRIEDRREKLFGNSDWNGIDFLEVSDDQLSMCVHFFGRVPESVTVANVRIEGGRRIRDIHAVKVEIDRAHDPELDDCLRITLDKFGDFSIYRLCLVEATPADVEGDRNRTDVVYRPLSGLDPRYACIDFTFKVDCPSGLDCKVAAECPPEVLPTPEINYLAKDYASFRQLIFDRLALIMSDWQERHVPDLGVTLVELLAYAGDYLSYYQDAVATEAYLDTARQRISVRRHARLVDYRMHEGNNARAWVTVWTAGNVSSLKSKDFYFITGFADIKAASGNVVRAADLDQVPQSLYEVFEPLVSDPQQEIAFLASHSEMHFYTWGDHECCLPKGATRATLLDEAPSAIEPKGESPPTIANASYVAVEAAVSAPQRVLDLHVDDVLIFEEIVGPTTGNPADADRAHRHAVRLTKVTPDVDELLNTRVLEIEWAPEDALPFSLCLSSRLPAPDCRPIENVSVARGNVVLVDHGRGVDEPLGPVDTQEIVGECACEGSVIESATVPSAFNPALTNAPLTFGQPLLANASASRSISQDPRLALPRLALREFVGTEDDARGPAWDSRYDLLASGGDERHLVAEMDDDGRPHLRFGDGELGRQPTAGTRFQAIYRIGNGPSGNVGSDTITYLVLREGTLSADAIKPRNPLPARGGQAPELTAEVKLLAPSAFRTRRERAITAADYTELAQRNPKIQRAATELRWTGSWYEARVAIDPAQTEEADEALLKEIEGYLFRYRRMRHDLTVAPARYVPLELALEVCVLPHYTRGHVKAGLLKVFSNRKLADGKLGFFHPDNLSFGDGIYLSRIVATARGVEGVETVEVTRLKRLNTLDGGAIESGVLPLDAMEIAELDNDPSFPENGQLELIMRGGR
jgi:hypothetical protein